jgi:flagellar basal-body rod protein FlgF
MHTGLYDAKMGMLVDQAKLDNIANNLANVNTAGFKADSMSFKATMQRKIYRDSITKKPVLVGNTTNAVVVDQVTPDMNEGALQQTGQPLDYAISGKGFFAVKDGDKILYTRDGQFSLSPNGDLVDKMGREVLDSALQPIKYSKGVKPVVFDVEDPSKLQKVGDTSFVSTAKSGQFILDPTAKVMNGYLESSNVNAVKEMVDMINASRYYDIAQKSVMTEDSLFADAIKVGTAR